MFAVCVAAFCKFKPVFDVFGVNDFKIDSRKQGTRDADRIKNGRGSTFEHELHGPWAAELEEHLTGGPDEVRLASCRGVGCPP